MVVVKKFACIGISNGASNDKPSSYQQSCQLIPVPATATATASKRSPIQHRCADAARDTAVDATISTTANQLDDAIISCLAPENSMPTAAATNADDNDRDREATANAIAIGVEFDSAVHIYPSDDSHLLRCRPTNIALDSLTILGISENWGANQDDTNSNSTRDVPVRVAIVEPCTNAIFGELSLEEAVGSCCCQHPRGNWERREVSQRDHNDRCINNLTQNVNLSIIDFTKIQDLRRGNYIFGSRMSCYPCIDTPGRVFHFLRSILNCNDHGDGGGLHCASPWVNVNSNTSADGGGDCGSSYHVVALLVNDPDNHENGIMGSSASDDFWNDVENREIDELLQFRTGDAAPSYFLHSTSRLSGDLIARMKGLSLPERAESNCTSRTSLLLVYRHLPPRDILSHRFLGQEMKYKGCLLETYLEAAEKTELGMGEETPAEQEHIVKHRMVSPPYLSHEQEYPGILDSLLENIDTIRNEVQTIPQWTAWPEKSHYDDNSWNVFPLCYTFPANDITKRKFVDQTCSFVPETTRLLRSLGPVLRTALFSRLDAGSRLGAHTGWEDLANHVLRVHIPLIVPGSGMMDDGTEHKVRNYNLGLCGAWVDGCVDTHEEGRIMVFDDSKVHRAFNYSDGERVVLIIDLARPQDLPRGTATGGHSDELDDFISGF